MREDDPLGRVLGEWQAPELPAAMDARMLAGFREVTRPSPWRRFRQIVALVPAPVPAAALVIAVAVVIGFRWGQPQAPRPRIQGYVTRIDAKGFQPLPNGAVRVVRLQEMQ